MDPVSEQPHKSWEAAPLLLNTDEVPVSHSTPLPTALASVRACQTGPSTFHGEVRRSIEKALTEGKLLEVVSVVREIMQTVSRSPVSVAVTGDSGNGMSSFINALRDIGHDTEVSAPTGVVRTTQTRARYFSSSLPNVELWDLPGMGATAQSLESYVREMQFHQYDLIIIIASEQFSSNHVQLARTITRMGKRFYVVWTKLDRDLSTSALSETQLLQNIQENICGSLRKEGVQEPPIYLVSSFEPLSHDFPKLRDTLQKDLSSIRCRGPSEMISQICEGIISDKVALMKASISTEYLQNVLGLGDADDLRECLQAYRLRFGVDDVSLQQVDQSMGAPAVECRALMKSQDLHTLCQGDWMLKFMTSGVVNTVLRFLGYFLSLFDIPVQGSRHMTHRRILDLVAWDTKTILKRILEDAIIRP